MFFYAIQYPTSIKLKYVTVHLYRFIARDNPNLHIYYRLKMLPKLLVLAGAVKKKFCTVGTSWKDGDDADVNDGSSEEEFDRKHVLPKIIGIGLQGVFEIIRECKTAHPGTVNIRLICSWLC